MQNLVNTVKLSKFKMLTLVERGEAVIRDYIFASTTLVLLLRSLSLTIHVIEFCVH